MIFEINKDKFQEAVSHTERITSKHVSLPVLSCILIEAIKDRVIIRSTNLDVGIEFFVGAKISNEGRVAVSGSIIRSFLSASVDKVVNFELKGNVINIKCGQSKASIKTSPHDDFPIIPKIEEGVSSIIESSEMVLGIRSVWYSASVSSIKPELSSIYIYQNEDFLVFVATDSFRLAEKRVRCKKVKSFEPVLIPYKNAGEIVKILESYKGEVSFKASKNQVSIIGGDFHISSRLVDGNFPDYKQILPKEFISKVTVLKQDTSNALKLSGVFADNFNQLSFFVDPKNKSCTIKTKNNDIGESEQIIKGSFEGENIELSFNLRYIVDCLQSIPEESISFCFAGLGKPLLIKPSNGGGFTYLVMPMNK